MNVLITNIHSLHNAGDAALLWATVQQLRENIPGCRITLAINLPETFQQYLEELKRIEPSQAAPEDLQVVGSYMHWARRYQGQGEPGWDVPAMLGLGLASLRLAFRARGSAGAHIQPPGSLPEGQQRLLQAYLEADLVVSVPGNFLYHSGRLGLPLLINLYSMAYASLVGKPWYLFPQSIGPLKRWWEIWLTKKALASARLVMLREEESRRFLEQHGFVHPRLYQVPDVAIDFQGFDAERGRKWLQQQGVVLDGTRPRLGLTAINWWVQTTDFTFQQQLYYEEALVEACRLFIDRMDGEVLLFSQVTGGFEIARDDIPARRIFERLQEYDGRVHLLDRGTIPHVLKAVYGQMDVFIGTRMHSNIFALSSGVPVLAIAYRYKTRGLMETLGLESWVLAIDRLGEEDGKVELFSRLEMLWQQAGELRPIIRERIENLALGARQAGRLAAEDFNRLADENG